MTLNFLLVPLKYRFTENCDLRTEHFCLVLSFQFLILFIGISPGHNLCATFKFSVSDIASSSYLMFTSKLSNCSEFNHLSICITILRMLYIKNIYINSTFSFSICPFGFECTFVVLLQTYQSFISQSFVMKVSKGYYGIVWNLKLFLKIFTF